MFREFHNWILDILFLKSCIFCGRADDYICQKCLRERFELKERNICHVCKNRISNKNLFVHTDCKDKTNLDGVFTCYKYNTNAKKLLRLIKFDGYYGLIHKLVEIMDNYFNNLPIGFDFAIPVPLHASRQRDRGFNQSEEILKKLTWNYRNILMRAKNTKQQANLDKDLRVLNMIDAFELVEGTSVSGKTILLFDDVFTTGSTLENCAKTLKMAGAKNVFALTWAGGG